MRHTMPNQAVRDQGARVVSGVWLLLEGAERVRGATRSGSCMRRPALEPGHGTTAELEKTSLNSNDNSNATTNIDVAWTIRDMLTTTAQHAFAEEHCGSSAQRHGSWISKRAPPKTPAHCYCGDGPCGRCRDSRFKRSTSNSPT